MGLYERDHERKEFPEYMRKILERDSLITARMKEFYKKYPMAHPLYASIDRADNYGTVCLFDRNGPSENQDEKSKEEGYSGCLEAKVKDGKMKFERSIWRSLNYGQTGNHAIALLLASVRRMRREGYNVIPVINSVEVSPGETKLNPAHK